VKKRILERMLELKSCLSETLCRGFQKEISSVIDENVVIETAKLKC
jgi:hypothetical protein